MVLCRKKKKITDKQILNVKDQKWVKVLSWIIPLYSWLFLQEHTSVRFPTSNKKKKYSHCWCLTFQVKLIFIRYWSAAVIEGSLQLFQPKHVYFSFFKHIVDDRVLYCKTEADRFTINIKNCIILPIISYTFAEGDE